MPIRTKTEIRNYLRVLRKTQSWIGGNTLEVRDTPKNRKKYAGRILDEYTKEVTVRYFS